MRCLVTGASGFVGGWLTRHLADAGDLVEVLPEKLDIGDADAVLDHLSAARPEVVYHLAALTHVGRSWEQPEPTFVVNAIGTLHLLEAARKLPSPPRVVLVSSAEVYGSGSAAPDAAADSAGDLTSFDEDAPLQPTSPYAASKVAAEYLGLQAFLGRGLDVVRVRPFNHVGPGQAESFVVSALARRIAEAERDGVGQVAVGNLAAARDFTDVRDVVRAYRMVATHGVPGEVYNVCSGVAVPIAELAARLVSFAALPVELVEDPSLFRPVDIPVLRGDAARLRALTGWRPEIELGSTLQEVLGDWRERLSRAGR